MTNQRWRVALWCATALLMLWVAWSARGALIPFVIGAVLAYAFSPVVDRLAALLPARTHQGDVIRRGIVVGLIYVVFFGSLAALGFALIPRGIDQVQHFMEELPDIAAEARTEVNLWLDRFRAQLPSDLRDEIDRGTQNLSDAGTDFVASLFTRSSGWISSTLGLIVGLLIVPLWMFYALRDRHFVERAVMRAVPDSLKPDAANMARIVDYVLGRYIRAQLFLGLIVGVSVGVVMSLLGVQFAIGLGLWAGITELIPIIGPWLGAAAGLVVVLATEPELFWIVAGVYLIVQVLENNFLVPRIQGTAVDIHPAMVILLIAIAGAIWGFPGMLVIIPITAIVRELFWYVDHRLRGDTPAEAFSRGHTTPQADVLKEAAWDAPLAEEPLPPPEAAEDPIGTGSPR